MYDTIETLRSEALRFFLEEEVLKFGDFTLKSGRKSPYFFNTGSLCSGRQLAVMGRLYAGLMQLTPEFSDATVVFGSAYKGIPISVATAIALHEGGREIRAVSDRKEAKTHGDRGGFLGVFRPGDRAVIVDDVVTDGATKLEAIAKLHEADCTPAGLIIAFDRGEPIERGGPTACEALQEKAGIPVRALLSIHDLIAARPDYAETLKGHLEEFAV